MNVIKRDGRKVQFDKDKIKLAVLKAFLEVDKEETSYAKDKAKEIANYIESLNKDIDNLVSQRKSLVERRKSLQDSIMDYEAQNSKLMMQLDMGGII